MFILEFPGNSQEIRVRLTEDEITSEFVSEAALGREFTEKKLTCPNTPEYCVLFQ